MQFERVYCKASHHRDDLYAYFIRRHQIAMGIIPDPEKVKEEKRIHKMLGNPGGTNEWANYTSSCNSSTSEASSDISNFSMEIEMLNRMHVDKNNNMKIQDLPVIYDWLLPEPNMQLYNERTTDNGVITFKPDLRPRIIFKDPVTKPKHAVINRQSALVAKFEGSLTGDLKNALRLNRPGDNSHDEGMPR